MTDTSARVRLLARRVAPDSTSAIACYSRDKRPSCVRFSAVVVGFEDTLAAQGPRRGRRLYVDLVCVPDEFSPQHHARRTRLDERSADELSPHDHARRPRDADSRRAHGRGGSAPSWAIGGTPRGERGARRRGTRACLRLLTRRSCRAAERVCRYGCKPSCSRSSRRPCSVSSGVAARLSHRDSSHCAQGSSK